MKQPGSSACGPKRNNIPAGPACAKVDVRLASIQEEIQQRIASDLHDATCQHLIAAGLSVMRMRSALGDRASAERLCDDIDGSIEQALKEIRAFAYLLHPQNLTADGLKTTIEQYACGFAARTSLKVTIEISPKVDRLPYKEQCSLLRVVQESLTNVFRHAQATEVEIKFETIGCQFRLQVMDNGRGMAAGLARCGVKGTSIGVGIPAMRARLRQLGGTLEFQSAKRSRPPGTTLCALFPHHLATGKQRSRKKTSSSTRGHANV